MFLLLSIYFGLFFGSIVIIRRVENILSIFLLRNTTINNEIVLNEYKTVVGYCMYLAIIYGSIIIGVLFICIILIWYIGLFSSIGLFSLFTFALRVFEQEAMELEKKARRLYCATSDLEQQYKKISHTWVHEAFPDF